MSVLADQAASAVTQTDVASVSFDSGRFGRKKLLLAILALTVIYFAGLAYYATVRPIDGDEGFYTTAARLVWQGKAPYRDFFYQQAPLLPYLYSWIWAVHPRSLVAMRFLSVACGATAVLLWGMWLVFAKSVPRKVALATFLVVLLNPYWVSWNVVVKTFAFANLLMTVAVVSLYMAFHAKAIRWFFAAGAALGLCASVRSLYGPLIPCLVLLIFYQEWRSSRPLFPKSFALCMGLICGLLPMIISFASDPRAFVFNNIRYHSLDAGYMWMNGKLVEGYQGFEHAAFVWFVLLGIRLIGMHPYFTAELLLAGVGVVSWFRMRRDVSGPYRDADHRYFEAVLLIFTAYTATALIPFPPYDQYFDSPLVPMLIPFVAEGLRVTMAAGRRRVLALAMVAPVLFAVEIGKETGWNSWDSVWQLPCYEQVTQVVEVNTHPDDVVLSFWPGFIFESGRRYFPGLEDHFIYRITSKISPAERARYHVASKDKIMDAISTRAVPVMVIPPWIIEYYNNLSPAEIQEFHNAVNANYSLITKVQDIAIYRRRPDKPVPSSLLASSAKGQ